MRKSLIGLVCAAVAGSLVILSAPATAQQKTEKQCRDEWKAAGGRKTTAKPARPKSTATPKATGGREAMIARERACGKDWKADKTAGKIPQGMTWPKYWSECDKRKKAEGM